MNVESMTIRLPEPKALKMRYLLALPELQFGGREARAWRCWDEMLALLRLWFETPYEGTFESTMESMLTTRELLALPGMRERLRWVGGDATPEVAGALDWKAKHYMREDAKEMLKALGRVPVG